MKLEPYTRVKLLTNNYENEGFAVGSIGYVIENYDDAYKVDFIIEEEKRIVKIVVKAEDVEVFPEPEDEDDLKIDMEAFKAEILAKVRRSTNKMIIHPTNKNPMDRPFGSWFAHIGVLKKGEPWPVNSKGTPLFPLCQINTAELPYLPPILESVAMLCVWLYPSELDWERGSCNGTGWVLRCYSSLSELEPTKYFYPRQKKKEPEPSFLWKLLTYNIDEICDWVDYVQPALIEWELAEDYPYPPFVESILTEKEYEIYRDLYFRCEDPMSVENVDVSKVGGWPTVIEFEPFGQFKHSPWLEFVLQIRSCPELGWGWFTPKDSRSFGFFAKSHLSGDWLFDRHSWQR